MSSISTLTCFTCRVAFHNPEHHRDHHKSDWHRYNLKRKVAELTPVTAEEFQSRVVAQREKDEAAHQVSYVYCQPCRKNFKTIQSYENHTNSKKHRELAVIADNMSDSVISTASTHEEMRILRHVRKPSLASSTADMDIEEVSSDEWDEDTENPIENNGCLFCTNQTCDLMQNLHHMTIEHSFFIPEVEYCIDVKGLLMYLGEKITKGFMCLWCNEKGRAFHSVDSVRQHMLDKGHCKMLHEGLALAEYADFYDYSPSYPDAEENFDIDSEVSVPVLDGSDYQLVLPSGNVIGHRSLMRYYRQNIDPNRQVVPVCHQNKVLDQYRALGYTAIAREAAARKAKDIQFMRRVQAKSYAKLGIKANKLQQHYRPQVNF